MTDAPPEQSTDSPDPGEVPEEYRMARGDRPDRIRKRNLITGLLLILLIGTIVGITIYSRSTSEETSYGVEEQARPPFGSDQGEQKKGGSAPERPTSNDK